MINVTYTMEAQLDAQEETQVVNGVVCSISRAREVVGRYVDPELLSQLSDVKFGEFIGTMGPAVFSLLSGHEEIVQVVTAMMMIKRNSGAI